MRIKGADDVAATFHARYDVLRKTYRYRILMTPVCSPLLWRFVCHYPYPLDRARMAAGGAASLKVSMTSPHSLPPMGKRTKNEIQRVRVILRSRLLWRPRSSMLVYEVTGKGFLRYMVRNIVGTLIEVGRGKLAPSDIPSILAARDRTQAGPTAPAQGLCLMKVEYEHRVIG